MFVQRLDEPEHFFPVPDLLVGFQGHALDMDMPRPIRIEFVNDLQGLVRLMFVDIQLGFRHKTCRIVIFIILYAFQVIVTLVVLLDGL